MRSRLCLFAFVLLFLSGGVAGAGTVVMVGGDIACRSGVPLREEACHHTATSDLLVDHDPDLVLTTGDSQYESGSLSDYQGSYDKTWGRLKEKTRPTPGNHDYRSSNASGYFDYFGSKAGARNKGYYSFNKGGWHFVALNTNIATSRHSRQVEWLRKDLTSTRNNCTLAYWHHPLFSSGHHGNHDDVKPIWKALSAVNADIVLSGHDHNYERFAPMSANGEKRRRGTRSFVVGNGGRNLRPIADVQPHSKARNATNFGVLKLNLRADDYRWRFLPDKFGSYTDAGTGDCH